jgi:hypothetical protein
MTAACPPDGRTFAGWLRQFAPHRPHALAAARFRLVTIEAAVRVRRASAADSLTRLLLASVPDPAGSPADALRRRIPLEPLLLDHLLAEAVGGGLLSGNGRFTLTNDGRRARDAGTAPVVERRTFRFLDLRPTASPAFLPAVGWPAPTALSPELDGRDLLRDALARPEAWRRALGFPLDVEEIAPPAEVAGGEAWRRIAVERAETVCAAVVGTSDPEPGWLAFPARPKSWSVEAREPVLRLPGNAIEPPPHEAIRAAWRDWCGAKGLGAAVADACQLQLNGSDATVTPPGGIAEALPGETWLTVNQGPMCWGFQLRIR